MLFSTKGFGIDNEGKIIYELRILRKIGLEGGRLTIVVVEDVAGSGRMDGGQFIKVTQNINKYFYAHSFLNTYIY